MRLLLTLLMLAALRDDYWDGGPTRRPWLTGIMTVLIGAGLLSLTLWLTGWCTS